MAQGTRKDVGTAVEAAEAAQRRLAAMTVFERARLCHRVAELLEQRKEEIARHVSLEQGKPYVAEALPEVEVAAEMFRDAAEAIKRLETAVIPSSDPAKRVLTIRQPRRGVRDPDSVELSCGNPQRIPVGRFGRRATRWCGSPPSGHRSRRRT